MKSFGVHTPEELIRFLATNKEIDDAIRLSGTEIERESLSFSKEMGLRVLESGQDSVIYVTKGKIAYCPLDIGLDIDLHYLQTHTLLLGTGEPYHKQKERGLLVAAHGDDAECLVFRFQGQEKRGSLVSHAAIGKELEAQFLQVVASLDDYYFGYDERYKKVYEAGANLWESDQPNGSLLMMLQKHPYLLQGRIIDLGCGEGRDSLYLAQQGLEVTGLDVSKAALDKARLRASELKLTCVTFVETNVIYLRNVKSATYDLALNMGCLHMMTDEQHRRRHLERVYEILKTGGYFMVDHCKQNWGKGFYSIPNYEKVADDLVPGKSIARRIRTDRGEVEIDLEVLPFSERSEQELIDEITEVGFETVEVYQTDTEAFGNSVVSLFRKP